MNIRNITYAAMLIILTISLIFLAQTATSLTEEEEALKEQIKEKYEQEKEKIEKECTQDPYRCSCDAIPCEDILEAEDERKEQLYDRCVDKRDECEQKKQKGIQEMETLKEEIEKDCRKDITKCSCSKVKQETARKDCELKITEAKYEAKRQREEKIKECKQDIERCDCSSIEDEAGRQECADELEKGKQLRDKIERACKENPINCDCSLAKEGKEQCEKAKQEGYNQATGKIKEILNKCFKDVDKCECDNIGLEEQSYIDFCTIQLSYGLDCKYKAVNCEKLDDVEIYPPGMPSWLGKYFSKTYPEYIENEKSKAAKLAAKIAKDCISDLDKCQCSEAPYGAEFCQRMKELQIQCYADNYDSCIVLESSPNIPPGMPDFIAGPLDKMIEGLRKAREGAVKTKAAKKVGEMILACMDNPASCDCSFAPAGSIKAFCEHKKELVVKCKDKKDYASCFTLDEEPLVTPDMPIFIIDYIKKNVEPKVEEKKIKIYNEMRQGTRCNEIATLRECKQIFS